MLNADKHNVELEWHTAWLDETFLTGVMVHVVFGEGVRRKNVDNVIQYSEHIQREEGGKSA